MLRRRLALCSIAFASMALVGTSCGVEANDQATATTRPSDDGGGEDTTEADDDPTTTVEDDDTTTTEDDDTTTTVDDDDTTTTVDDDDTTTTEDDGGTTTLPELPELPDLPEGESTDAAIEILAEIYVNLGLTQEQADCLAEAILTADGTEDPMAPFTECGVDPTDFEP